MCAATAGRRRYLGVCLLCAYFLTCQSFTDRQYKAAIVNRFPWCYEIIPAVGHVLHELNIAYDVFVVQTSAPEVAEAVSLEAVLASLGAPEVLNYDLFISRHIKYSSLFLMDWYSGGWLPEPLRDNLDLLTRKDSNIYIFVHEPDRVLDHCDMDTSGNWIESVSCQALAAEVLGHPRVNVLVTAPFVKQVVEQLLNTQEVFKQVHVFVPVFPWKPARTSTQVLDKLGFVVQGSLDSSRRNYSSVFAVLQHQPDILEHPNFSLMFVGKADGYPPGTEVAASWGNRISCHRNLPLMDYYQKIALGEFMLPLFPINSRYFTIAGSSTITTSIITLTPMIASQELLDAYSYLTRCSVYIWPTEDLTMQMRQALTVSNSQQYRVSTCLKAVQVAMIEDNVHLIDALEDLYRSSFPSTLATV